MDPVGTPASPAPTYPADVGTPPRYPSPSPASGRRWSSRTNRRKSSGGDSIGTGGASSPLPYYPRVVPVINDSRLRTGQPSATEPIPVDDVVVSSPGEEGVGANIPAATQPVSADDDQVVIISDTVQRAQTVELSLEDDVVSMAFERSTQQVPEPPAITVPSQGSQGVPTPAGPVFMTSPVQSPGRQLEIPAATSPVATSPISAESSPRPGDTYPVDAPATNAGLEPTPLSPPATTEPATPTVLRSAPPAIANRRQSSSSPFSKEKRRERAMSASAKLPRVSPHCLKELNIPDTAITSILFTDSDAWLGGANGSVYVYDVGFSWGRGSAPAVPSSVNDVLARGQASAAAAATLSGGLQVQLASHRDRVVAMAAIHAAVWTAGADGSVHIWTQDERTHLSQVELSTIQDISDMQYNASTGLVAFASRDGYVRLVNAKSHLVAQEVDLGSAVHAVQFVPSATARCGYHLWCGTDDGLMLLDIDSGDFKTLYGHTKAVIGLTVIPFRRSGSLKEVTQVWTASEDGSVRLWSDDGHFVRVIEDHRSPLVLLAKLSHGQAWSYSESGTILAHDSSGRTTGVVEIRAGPSSIEAVPTAVSVFKDRIWTAFADRTIKVWMFEAKVLEEDLRDMQARQESLVANVNRIMAAANQRIQELERENRRQSARLDHISETHNQDLSEVNKSLDNETTAVSNLGRENVRLALEVKDAATRYTEADQFIRKLESDLANSQGLYQTTVDERDALLQELAIARANGFSAGDNSVAPGSRAFYEKEISQLRDLVEQLRSHHASQIATKEEQQTAELRRMRAEFESRLAEESSSWETQFAQLTSLTPEERELFLQSRQAVGESKLARENAELRSAIIELRGQVRVAETLIADTSAETAAKLQITINQLTNDLEEQKRLNEAKQEAVDALGGAPRSGTSPYTPSGSHTLAELRDRCEELEQAVRDGEAEYAQLIEQRDLLQEELSQSVSQHQQVCVEVASLAEQNRALISQIEDNTHAQSEYDELRNRNAELERDSAAVHAHSQALQAELVQSQSQAAEFITQSMDISASLDALKEKQDSLLTSTRNVPAGTESGASAHNVSYSLHGTFVYIDLSDASSLFECSAEVVERALDVYLDTVTSTLSSYRGHELYSDGRAVLIAFPSNDAESACLFAVEVQRNLAHASWPDQVLVLPDARLVHGATKGDITYAGLRVRIGVSSGHTEVTVSVKGESQVSHYSGEGTHAAVRIALMASPGETLVDAGIFTADNKRRLRGRVSIGEERDVIVDALAGDRKLVSIKDVTHTDRQFNAPTTPRADRGLPPRACPTLVSVDLPTVPKVKGLAASVHLFTNTLRRVARTQNGHIVTAFKGHGYVFAFHAAADGVRFATSLHTTLLNLDWSEALLSDENTKEVRDPTSHCLLFKGLRARVGVHGDENAKLTLNEYTGETSYDGSLLSIVHGISQAAQPGQTVVSASTWESVRPRDAGYPDIRELPSLSTADQGLLDVVQCLPRSLATREFALRPSMKGGRLPAALESQATALASEIASLQEKVAFSSKKAIDLQSGLAQSEAKLSGNDHSAAVSLQRQLLSEVSGVRDQNVHVELQLSALATKQEELYQTLVDLRSQAVTNEKLQKEQLALNRRAQDMSSQLKVTQSKLTEVLEDDINVRSQSSTWQTQLAEAQATIAMLEDDVRTMEADLRAQKQVNLSLGQDVSSVIEQRELARQGEATARAQLEEALRALEHARTSIDEDLKANSDKYTEQVLFLSAALKDCQADKRTLQSEKANLSKQKTVLERELVVLRDSLEQEAQSWAERVADFQKDRETLMTLVEKQGGDLTKLRDEIRHLEAERADMSQQAVEMQAQARADHERIQHELDSVRSRLNHESNERALLSSRDHDQAHELTQALTKVETLQKETSALKEQLDLERQSTSREHDTSNSERTNWLAQIGRLQESCRKLEEEKRDLLREHARDLSSSYPVTATSSRASLPGLNISHGSVNAAGPTGPQFRSSSPASTASLATDLPAPTLESPSPRYTKIESPLLNTSQIRQRRDPIEDLKSTIESSAVTVTSASGLAGKRNVPQPSAVTPPHDIPARGPALSHIAAQARVSAIATPTSANWTETRNSTLQSLQELDSLVHKYQRAAQIVGPSRTSERRSSVLEASAQRIKELQEKEKAFKLDQNAAEWAVAYGQLNAEISGLRDEITSIRVNSPKSRDSTPVRTSLGGSPASDNYARFQPPVMD